MEQYPGIYLYKRMVQAKIFIDEHFSEDIDLDNIAEEAFFSKFHFIRLFKSIYSNTPHQYLMKVRIEQSKQYLEQGFTVTDACYHVGFSSTSSFTGLFKKLTGISPSIYQARYKERQERIRLVPLQFIPNCFAAQKGWTENSNFQQVI